MPALTITPSPSTMSTSNLGLDSLNLRTTLPILTGALYTFGLGGGLYNFVDPIAGARFFGIVLPGTHPTPTEAAYTKINGIRNLTTATFGLGMIGFLQFSNTCTKLPVGPFVAAAVRKGLGYSMLIASLVTFSDGYVLQQFSDAKDLSAEAVDTAKKQRQRYAALALPIALLGVGWIYA